ncbi:oligosaccharide flippase family protein [Sphingomonas nostoxanthinifaciens]|uniref:oligosaccharide flippase family protein n=1 Tax=Sphingomonas nostoxanthinifaciens TaxID=2872652 RepID=UPI001CC1C556|nr:oligosaccharide flippase family protein [Sphingomonas nostoxanthinifaciens]UAK23267.1 oligosaccharide flippase family protein [Sphingomonas nostoxanthinifaciens]
MLKNLASMSSLNLFKAGVQFGISTLVALFVLPAQYGLITFSLPIIQFIALFTDMGLASAIVRQTGLTAEQAGGAFSFSLVVGLIAALLLAASGFPLEHGTKLAGLGWVLTGLSLAVFFSIAAGVPRAMLERGLRYQEVAKIEGIGVIVAALACAVALPFGAGVFAVVAFHIVLQAFRAIRFTLSTYRDFSISLQWRRIGALLSFGGWVLATNLVNFGARNAQNLLIGAVLGATAVGLYGMAYQFMILPLMALAWPASGVLLATLTKLNDVSPERFQAPIAAVSMITAMLAFPLMMWMTFGLALPITKLLSPHWHDILPLMALLTPLGAVQALAAYNGSVLLARGYARLQFYVNVVSSIALLVGFVAALPFGLKTFAVVYLVVGTIVAVGQIWAKIWAAGMPPLHYLRALAPAVIATAGGYAVAALLGLSPQSWAQWAAVTAAYGAVVLLVYAIIRHRIIAALKALLRSPIDQQTADEAAHLELDPPAEIVRPAAT